MFTTDSVTLQALSDALQQAGVSTLAGQLPSINTRYHVRAYGDIVTRLAQRGYTLAQITSWDRSAEFETDLTVFYALSMAFVNTTVDLKFLAQFDRRQELSGGPDMPAVGLTINGVFQDPLGTAGQPQVGKEDTSRDVFSWPDPGDSDELGKATIF